MTLLGIALALIGYAMLLLAYPTNMTRREIISAPYGWWSISLFVAGIALLVWA